MLTAMRRRKHASRAARRYTGPVTLFFVRYLRGFAGLPAFSARIIAIRAIMIGPVFSAADSRQAIAVCQ
jgi:hypothetical protein